MLIGCLVARTDSGTVFWPDTLLCVLVSWRLVAQWHVLLCLRASWLPLPPCLLVASAAGRIVRLGGWEALPLVAWTCRGRASWQQ